MRKNIKDLNFITDEDLNILQNNLVYIRKYFNWSEEYIGDLIGLTRQAINNFELGKAKIKKIHYIALVSIILFNISNNDKDLDFIDKALNNKIMGVQNTYNFEDK